jgi:hypothetical protein
MNTMMEQPRNTSEQDLSNHRTQLCITPVCSVGVATKGVQEHLELAHEELVNNTALQCSQCIRQFNDINEWIQHTIHEHQKCEDLISCTIGSYKDTSITTTTHSYDEKETTDGIKLNESVVLQQKHQVESTRSFEGSQKLKRKWNQLDDVQLSHENKLLPSHRPCYASSEFNTGSWYAQDYIPIDPALINYPTGLQDVMRS